MSTEECTHDVLEDGVCTLCGICSVEEAYVDEHAGKFTGTETNHRYSVKSQFLGFEQAIKKILVPLQLESLRLPLIELLNTVSFKFKLSKEDKVAVGLYHLLISDGFPITASDILAYTRLDKYRLLKIHRDSFARESRTADYLRAIFDRSAAFIGQHGIEAALSFEDFLDTRNTFASADPSDLCLACMFSSSGARSPSRLLKAFSKSRGERIRKLLKRLQVK